MKQGSMVLLMIALLGAGCTRLLEGEDPAAAYDLVGVEWVFTSFEQPDGIQRGSGPQGITLMFLEDERLEGLLFAFDEVNARGDAAYHATYKVEQDGSLSIRLLDFYDNPHWYPHGSRWFEYYYALSTATSYEIERNQLRLYYEYDSTPWVLNFQAQRDDETDR